MPIENVSGVKPFLAQVPKKEEVEQKIAQAEKEIKDGKKKLALTLGGLAVASIATIGIICKIKSGKKISQKETKNTADIAKNALSDSVDRYTRYKGGIGKYVGTPCKVDDKTITQTIDYVAPNSTDITMFTEIIEDDTKKTIDVFRHTPKNGTFLSADVSMEKDANGNIIKVINNKYNKGADKGGQRIITTIQRDETGKVIGHNREIYEIPVSELPKRTRNQKRRIPM